MFVTNDASSKAAEAASDAQSFKKGWRGSSAALGRSARRVVVLGCAFLMASCSSLKLGYNNVDTLLVYAVDRYVDLEDEQEHLLRQRIRGLVSWHRGTQLSDYRELLKTAKNKLNGTVSADDVLAFQREINERLIILGSQAAPDIAQLALTLQPSQIEHLKKKLEADNKKERRDLVQLAGRENLDERSKRYQQRIETWMGSVNPEQRRLVSDTLASRAESEAWWMDERERRQQDFVALLTRIHSEQPTVQTATAWVNEYFHQLKEPPQAARRTAALQFRARNAELIAQIINSATPQQRSALSKKLRGYVDDLATLASEPQRRS